MNTLVNTEHWSSCVFPLEIVFCFRIKVLGKLATKEHSFQNNSLFPSGVSITSFQVKTGGKLRHSLRVKLLHEKGVILNLI